MGPVLCLMVLKVSLTRSPSLCREAQAAAAVSVLFLLIFTNGALFVKEVCGGGGAAVTDVFLKELSNWGNFRSVSDSRRSNIRDSF